MASGESGLSAIEAFFAFGRVFIRPVQRLEILLSRLDEAPPFFFEQSRYRQSGKRFLRCSFVLLLGFLQALKTLRVFRQVEASDGRQGFQ